METLTFDPVLPSRVLASLWAVAVILCVAYAFWKPSRLALPRRMVLLFCHFAILSSVMALLYRPTWVLFATRSGKKPLMQVLCDSSASMSTADGGSGKTRAAVSSEALRANLSAWSRDFDVQVFRFDKGMKRVDAGQLGAPVASGSLSDVAGAVEESVAQTEKPSLILMVSDGIHNSTETDLDTAARTARAAAVPVYTWAVGTDVAISDIGVSVSSAEELAFVNQRARIGALISQSGFNNTEVQVQLKQGEEVLGVKTLRFAENAEAAVDFEIQRDKPGLYAFEIQVKPQQNEALLSNNQRRVTLRVINERIRVLLLEGKPYWDSKFLSRVLKRDPNVLLTTATQLRADRVVIDPPSQDDAPGAAKVSWKAPKDSRKPLEDRSFLAQFNVVMVGREASGFFTPTAIESLRDWMSRGGGHLVCTRGRPASESELPTAFASVLPVAWAADEEKRFSMKLTERGRALTLMEAGGDPDVVLNALPSLVTATKIEQERSLSVVLARAQSETEGPMAVLSVQNYGSGKSVVLEGQGMWRWAFRSPNDKLQGEELFRSFWANMVRWLAGSNEFLPSQTLVIRPGKPLYQLGEKPVLYVLQREGADADKAKDASVPQVEILRESNNAVIAVSDAQPIPREPQMKQVEFGALDEGRYRARLVSKPQIEASFEILPPLREKLDVRARPEWLRRLSSLSDGEVLDEKTLPQVGEKFRAYAARYNTGMEKKRPAWDRPWVLAILLGLPALTWWLRRRWGAI